MDQRERTEVWDTAAELLRIVPDIARKDQSLALKVDAQARRLRRLHLSSLKEDST